MANEIADINKVLTANAAALNGTPDSDIAAVNGVNWPSSMVMTFNSSYSWLWPYNSYGSGNSERAYITITPDATFATTIGNNFARVNSQAGNYVDYYPASQNDGDRPRGWTSTLTASGYTCTGDCTVSLTQDYNDIPSSSSPVCLTADTLITMANGNKKKIADIKEGDEILAADLKELKYVSSTVKKNVKSLGRHLVKIKTINTEVICTTDHPFFEEKRKWSSFFAGKTNRYYPHIPNHCQRLEVGDKLFTKNGFETIESAIFIEELVPTWQIMEAEYNTYYANDILTLIELR